MKLFIMVNMKVKEVKEVKGVKGVKGLTADEEACTVRTTNIIFQRSSNDNLHSSVQRLQSF
jgi:hypothetical protein